MCVEMYNHMEMPLGRLKASTVEEAVPLLHSGLELAPMLEAALAQAEAHYAAKGMKVVGYYHANERHADNELGGAARAGA